MRRARWKVNKLIAFLARFGGAIAWLVGAAFRYLHLGAYIEAGSATRPPSLDSAINDGVLQYERGADDEALSTFERLAQTEEGAVSPEVQTNLALLREKMGDDDGALVAFRRSIAISYGLPEQVFNGLSVDERSVLAAINRYELTDRNQLLSSAALLPSALDAGLLRLKDSGIVEEVYRPNGRRLYRLALKLGDT